jgi:hypothetical protein
MKPWKTPLNKKKTPGKKKKKEQRKTNPSGSQVFGTCLDRF